MPCLQYCRLSQRLIQREKTLKMIPKRYTKTVYLRTADKTEKGADDGKNEQQEAAGMVFLLK